MDNRLKWLDEAKGMGIILVIIGHTLTDSMRINNCIIDAIYCIIYTFHMPLMFFLSGYAYKKYNSNDSLKIFLKKKIKSLLKPWFTYSILLYVVFTIAYQINIIRDVLESSSTEIYSVLQYLLVSLLGKNPYGFHLWYLYVLFIVSLLIKIFSVIFRSYSDMVNLLILMICTIIFIFTPTINGVVGYCLFEINWFVLGTIYEKNEKKIKSKLYYIISWITLVVSICIINYFSFDYNCFTWKLMRMPICLGIILSIIDFIKRNKVAEKQLMILGNNSFVVYLLHQPLCAFVVLVLYDKKHINCVTTIILGVIISIICPYIYQSIVRKNKVLSLISKKIVNI